MYWSVSSSLKQVYRPPDTAVETYAGLVRGLTDHNHVNVRKITQRCTAGSAPGTPCSMDSSSLDNNENRLGSNQYDTSGALACTPRRHSLQRYRHARCLSPSEVGVLSKLMDGSSWFLARRLPSTYPTQSCDEIRLSPKTRVLPPTPKLCRKQWTREKFCHGPSIVAMRCQLTFHRGGRSM